MNRLEITNRVQEAMLKRKHLTMVVDESDGEHTVNGRVIGYKAEAHSLQIHNEWGRFNIPLACIVRVL
jgi:hypothetical protein